MADKNTLRSKLDLPLVVAPMFLISNPKLALACCGEGIVGSFPALNQRTNAGLEQWLIEMNDGLKKLKQDHPNKTVAPYAVNLIVHPTNPRLQEDLDLCVKYKVPIIITSLGAVPELVKKVHSYGGIVLHDVTTIRHAKSAAKAGVDGLIAVSVGAGGHAGTMNPLTLVKEIREFFDGIIALAGGLTSGADILAAKAMGADVAYMGTRFINTTESSAAQDYKDMICKANASDIIYTDAVSGVPANFIRQSLEKAGYNIKKLQRSSASGPKLKSLESEAKAWKNIWSAGHGVSNIDDIPSVRDLVQKMKQEYAATQQKIAPKVPNTSQKNTPKSPKFKN